MEPVRIAAAQTPDFREDLDGALAWLVGAAAEAEAAGARLLCFPEGFLQGYLTEEAPARRHALDLASADFRAVLDRLPRGGPTLVFGLIEREGEGLHNTAVVVRDGVLLGRYRKRWLLKGEQAVFTPGADCPVFETAGTLRFGVNICYDTNFPEAAAPVAAAGATLLVCCANNMLPRAAAEAWKDRHNPIRGERCREAGLWMISADVTGERDGRIGWGPTALLDPAGEVVAQLPLDAPGLLVAEVPCAAD